MSQAAHSSHELPLWHRDGPASCLPIAAINTYRTCPLRYYFQYEAKLPQRAVAASALFGTAIQQAIADHFRALAAGRSAISAGDLMGQYQAQMDRSRDAEVIYGADNRAALDLVASRMLKAFAEHPSAIPPRGELLTKAELAGKIAERLPELSGCVFLIAKTRRDLVLRDYRISRSRLTDEQLETATDSVLLLGELARLTYGASRSLQLESIVLFKTKDATIDTYLLAASSAAASRAKVTAEHVWRAIHARAFYPTPSPIHCSSCPFRQPCRH